MILCPSSTIPATELYPSIPEQCQDSQPQRSPFKYGVIFQQIHQFKLCACFFPSDFSFLTEGIWNPELLILATSLSAG